MSRRGFSLIEVMLVVAIVGALASIAIPRLIAQQRKAKTAQRSVQTRLIENAAKRYFEEKAKWPSAAPVAKGASQTSSVLSATWNPAALGPTASFDADQTDWKELMVPVEGRSRFQYQLTGTGTAAGGCNFVLTSRADLDGNGVSQVITRSWELGRSGGWTVNEAVTGDLSE